METAISLVSNIGLKFFWGLEGAGINCSQLKPIRKQQGLVLGKAGIIYSHMNKEKEIRTNFIHTEPKKSQILPKEVDGWNDQMPQ